MFCRLGIENSKAMDLNNSVVAVVVPVFNPEPGLMRMCMRLVDMFACVVVVDDGSALNCESFSRLPSGIVVLRHGVNRGKGTAIKTAISWLVENRPGIRAAVFVDGDGQHRVEDASKVAERCLTANMVTLGVRDFSRSGIPFRSRFGNVLTSWLVRQLLGFPIYDTQTGLRGIPSRLFQSMLELPGERYEYEMRLFGMLRHRGECFEQVPIVTLYIDSNRASHFNPIKDSVRIYKGLFGDVLHGKR